MAEKKTRKKKEPTIKYSKHKCFTNTCEKFAEISPPGRYCTQCRLSVSENSRKAYNSWKESRGLPVETIEEELDRVAKETALYWP